MSEQIKILILGGGFGGLYTAPPPCHSEEPRDEESALASLLEKADLSPLAQDDTRQTSAPIRIESASNLGARS
jgi:hypothetical protein